MILGHRLVAVTLGVIWGVLVTLYMYASPGKITDMLIANYDNSWPNSARAELKRKLGTLWMRMGLLWNSDPLRGFSLEGNSVRRHTKQNRGLNEESQLLKMLINISPLLSQASKEFRLKGPFPTTEYKNIIRSTQEILDSFHMMNVSCNFFCMLVCDLHIKDYRIFYRAIVGLLFKSYRLYRIPIKNVSLLGDN